VISYYIKMNREMQMHNMLHERMNLCCRGSAIGHIKMHK
jgi:hypothetical protein